MRDIKPKTEKFMTNGPVGLSKGESKPIYPSIRLGLEHIPEAKNWKLGQEHEVTLKLKMVGLSQSRFQNDAEFEIIGIDPGEGTSEDESEEEAE